MAATDTFALAGVALEFVTRLTFVYTAFCVADFSFSREFAFVAISLAIAISSALVVFRSDYQLNFSHIQVVLCLYSIFNNSQNNFQNSVKTLIDFGTSLPYANISEICGIDAAISYTAAVALILVVGPMVSGFSAWWLLLNIPFHVVLFGLCFTQQFYSKISMKIVNQIVMKVR